MKKKLTCLAALVAVSLVAPDTSAGHRICYDFEELNVPDGQGGELFTSWYGLNDRGLLVGNYCIDANCGPVGPDAQFVGGAIYDERAQTFETFTLPPPYNWVGSLKVNNRGVIAGEAAILDPSQGFVGGAPFIRHPNGQLTILAPPKPNATAFAEGINDRGVVVGWFNDPDEGERARGFVWRSGRYTIYDAVAAPGDTRLFEINDWGAVVGNIRSATDNRGFVDWGRGPRFFEPPGATRTWAFGINNWGQVAGYADTGVPDTSGFLKTFRRYRTFDFPGAVDTKVSDVNNWGVMVGTYDAFSFGIIIRPRLCR